MKGISFSTNVVILIATLIGVILCVFAMQVKAKVDPVTQQISTDAESVSHMITFTFIILWASAIAIALGALYVIVVNFKRLIPTFIGLGIFVLLLLFSTMFIYVDESGYITTLKGATPRVIWWTDFGLRATYVMSVVAVIAIVLGNGLRIFRYFQK